MVYSERNNIFFPDGYISEIRIKVFGICGCYDYFSFGFCIIECFHSAGIRIFRLQLRIFRKSAFHKRIPEGDSSLLQHNNFLSGKILCRYAVFSEQRMRRRNCEAKLGFRYFCYLYAIFFGKLFIGNINRSVNAFPIPASISEMLPGCKP